ncbi:MAG: fibronectin type III domain-containing protein [Roseburia sp.]|nr:fibronectin type III domain-containing protein [Roseburia sp.]MCM1278643.1 fibronectin type III domain-containing protein [Robinsoniella sp.]
MKKLNMFKIKQIFLLLSLLVLLFPAIKVQAEEKTYYPDYHWFNDVITYKGEDIFRRNYLYKSVIHGSNGGTLTIDLDNHKIIFNNFKDYYDVDDWIFFDISTYDMEIILIGDNEIIKSESSKCKFEMNDRGKVFTFRGPGSLTLNMTMASYTDLVFKDCEINIHPEHEAAMSVEKIEIYDSDFNLSTGSVGFYQNAYLIEKLTMRDSSLKATSTASEICIPWFMGEDKNDQPYSDFQEIFFPLSNEIIVDENGCTLYPIQDEFNGVKYFAFTKDKDTYKSWREDASWTVNILSPSRIERLKAVEQVEDKIAAIKTVTSDSGEKIRDAREAYDNLDEEIRYKVKNIDVLENAEAAFKEINQNAANKVIDMISKLETITVDSGEKIKDAQDAYNNLTKEQKELVPNYEDIEKAWIEFQKVLEQKEQEAVQEGTWTHGMRDFSMASSSNGSQSDKAQGIIVKTAKSKQKKTLTLKWQKGKNCSGYQISYSEKKTFKNQKKILVKGRTKTSYTIKKLKSGKTYYVRIRSYRTVNKKRSYGSWSKVYKVKVK